MPIFNGGGGVYSTSSGGLSGLDNVEKVIINPHLQTYTFERDTGWALFFQMGKYQTDTDNLYTSNWSWYANSSMHRHDGRYYDIACHRERVNFRNGSSISFDTYRNRNGNAWAYGSSNYIVPIPLEKVESITSNIRSPYDETDANNKNVICVLREDVFAGINFNARMYNLGDSLIWGKEIPDNMVVFILYNSIYNSTSDLTYTNFPRKRFLDAGEILDESFIFNSQVISGQLTDPDYTARLDWYKRNMIILMIQDLPDDIMNSVWGNIYNGGVGTYNNGEYWVNSLESGAPILENTTFQTREANYISFEKSVSGQYFSNQFNPHDYLL